MSGKPTASAKACTSVGGRAAAEAAVGTPAARSASFIDGLSRHSHAVRTDVPGIVQLSRTCAAAMVCASIVASSRSTQSLSWTQRTASVMHADVDHGGDLVVVRHPALELVVEHLRRALADADDGGADLGQRADEMPLGRREGRLDEDDVHDRMVVRAGAAPAHLLVHGR